MFLTGHKLWWFPFIFLAAGVEGGLTEFSLIIFGEVLSALYWSYMPWIMRKYVWHTTEDESFLIGHPTGFLSLISGFVAKRVGNKERSTEDLKVPKQLSFFREISITGSLVIFVMYIVVGIIIPSLIVEGENIVLSSINS